MQTKQVPPSGAAIDARQRALAFCARPGPMTAATGRHAHRFDDLPGAAGELVRVVQGLCVYDVVAADFYGFAIPGERRSETHLRPVEAMLAPPVIRELLRRAEQPGETMLHGSARARSEPMPSPSSGDAIVKQEKATL